jgi:hypothetical protein
MHHTIVLSGANSRLTIFLFAADANSVDYLNASLAPARPVAERASPSLEQTGHSRSARGTLFARELCRMSKMKFLLDCIPLQAVFFAEAEKL